MKDLYAILGVQKGSSPDDIKHAYRRLASQHHPDKGGDTQRFQEIQQAYAVLSDPEQRRAYDNPQVRNVNMNFSGAAPFNLDEIFNMFGARVNPNQSGRSQQTRINLWLSLYDVVVGGRRAISVASAQGQANVEIDIPPGISDGDTVRYARIGPGSQDLIVTFRVKPDAQWQRQGDCLYAETLVSLWDLILGADVEIDTITGSRLSVTVPPRTAPGATLRIRGQGIPHKNQPSHRGDLMLRVQPTMPSVISEELLEHIRRERGQ